MNLLNYFYKTNKGFIISFIIVIALFLIGETFSILLSGSKIFQIYTISFLGSIILDLLLIISLILLATVLFLNNFGLKRENLLKFYGKNSYLLYSLALNFFVLIIGILILCLLVVNYNVYTFIEADYIKGQAFINLHLESIFYISILLDSMFFVTLKITNKLKNSKFKYVSKKRKTIEISKSIIVYFLFFLGIFYTLIFWGIIDSSLYFSPVINLDILFCGFFAFFGVFIITVLDYIRAYYKDVFI